MEAFSYTENCDPELIREKIEEIEGYVASLQPGESFFENKEKGLVIRANVEVSDDGDGVNCRTIGVVREEEGNDKKGWLVAAKGGHIFVVRELVDNKDYGDDKGGLIYYSLLNLVLANLPIVLIAIL